MAGSQIAISNWCQTHTSPGTALEESGHSGRGDRKQNKTKKQIHESGKKQSRTRLRRLHCLGRPKHLRVNYTVVCSSLASVFCSEVDGSSSQTPPNGLLRSYILSVFLLCRGQCTLYAQPEALRLSSTLPSFSLSCPVGRCFQVTRVCSGAGGSLSFFLFFRIFFHESLFQDSV